MAEHLSNDYRQVLLSLAPYDNVRLFIILSKKHSDLCIACQRVRCSAQRGEMFTTHGQPLELLRDVVDEVGHAYTSHLRALVRERAAVGNYAFELLVQPDSAVNPPPYSYARIDAITLKPETAILRAVADEKRTVEQTFRTPNGTTVSVHALAWESCAIHIHDPNFDLHAIGSWLTRWLDPDETRAPDSDGLSSVIHGIAWQTNAEALVLRVDFGSAPTDAFFELISVISENGSKYIEVDTDEEGEDPT